MLILPTAGRIRAASDLLSQYLPANIRAALIASYEFVLHTIHPSVYSLTVLIS